MLATIEKWIETGFLIEYKVFTTEEKVYLISDALQAELFLGDIPMSSAAQLPADSLRDDIKNEAVSVRIKDSWVSVKDDSVVNEIDGHIHPSLLFTTKSPDIEIDISQLEQATKAVFNKLDMLSLYVSLVLMKNKELMIYFITKKGGKKWHRIEFKLGDVESSLVSKICLDSKILYIATALAKKCGATAIHIVNPNKSGHTWPLSIYASGKFGSYSMKVGQCLPTQLSEKKDEDVPK